MTIVVTVAAGRLMRRRDDREIAVAYASDGLQSVSKSGYIVCQTAYDDDLEAVVVIDMHVCCRDDPLVKAVLELGNSGLEPWGAVIVHQ